MDRGGKALEEEGEIPDSRGSGWRKECPGLLSLPYLYCTVSLKIC